VPFIEDQHSVGEFGSGCEHESLREAVRSGTAGRDLHDVYAFVGQDGIEWPGELAGTIADEEPEFAGVIIEIHE
jgi:hypothetical protein